jgi:hypothetical protein
LKFFHDRTGSMTASTETPFARHSAYIERRICGTGSMTPT